MSAESGAPVLAALDPDWTLALAGDLVAAAGENPGGSEHAVVEVLARTGRELGLEVELQDVAPGRQNVLLTLPGTGRGTGDGLLFLGHSDVVPAGPGWSRDPFEPHVADGRLYGRGATDMKGGLAAVLAALRAVAAVDADRPGPLTLAVTVDEEDLGLGIRALVDRGLPYRYGACVVAEPTDLETVIACRGDSYHELTVSGRSAHSGRPSDGRNAIMAAARILRLLEEDQRRLARHPDPLLGYGTWSPGLITGGESTSMVAPTCQLSIDRRLMPDEDAGQIREELLAAITEAGIDGDGIEVSSEVTMSMPGFRTPADHRFVVGAGQALVQAGVSSRVTGWTAACDGGFIAHRFGIPTIVLGPGGINDQAHQPDESVGVDELAQAARAYALLAVRR